MDFKMTFDNGLLSISEVAKITGVKPVTLRAWQRRFGLVNPSRTKKGHRMFCSHDIQRINEIVAWLNRGVSISRVKPLLGQTAAPSEDTSEPWLNLQQSLHQAVVQLDEKKLNNALDEVEAIYPRAIVFRYLLQPWLTHCETLFATRDIDAWLMRQWLFGQLSRRLAAYFFKAQDAIGKWVVFVSDEKFNWLVLQAQYELSAAGIYVLDMGVVTPNQLDVLTQIKADGYLGVFTDTVHRRAFNAFASNYPDKQFVIYQTKELLFKSDSLMDNVTQCASGELLALHVDKSVRR